MRHDPIDRLDVSENQKARLKAIRRMILDGSYDYQAKYDAIMKGLMLDFGICQEGKPSGAKQLRAKS